MSSRQEQKEQRRREREAAQEAERRAQVRRRTLGLVVGGILALAAVAAIVVVVLAGGDDKGDGPKGGTPGQANVPIPPQREKDLTAAAKAAGCILRDFPKSYEDREHVTDKVVYETNPPAFGPHIPPPDWAADGNYAGQGTPPSERIVHALEHGRIVLQYKPGTSPRQIGQLETLFKEKPLPDVVDGYNTLLVENNTNMPYAVAATAWTHIIGCKTFNDKTFDALRAFRTKYVDKAPELIQTPE